MVEEALGRREPVKAVTGVRLRDTGSGATRDVPADGLFVAIGHDPATKLFAGQLELLEGGYIKIVPGTTRTSVEGVYAAGDCAEFVYRQAVVAAGMGCMAALERRNSSPSTPPTKGQDRGVTGAGDDRRLRLGERTRALHPAPH